MQSRVLGQQLGDLVSHISLYCFDECHKQQLIEELNHTNYISTTVDLCSSHKRGFLGITAKYIDKHTAACFACTHMPAIQELAHRIKAEIANTCDEFQITTKVTSCVTYNTSKIVKALKLLNSACNSMPAADGADTESSDSKSRRYGRRRIDFSD